MADYKEMYLTMARETEKAVTLAGQALHALITAQRVCEEMYINAPDPVIELVNTDAPSRQDMRSRRDGSAVVYTEAEKRRIDNILKAFAGFIREQSYFDIIFSEKIGYFQILSGLCATEPVSVIKTAEEMADTLFYEVISEVVDAPESQRLDRGTLKLSEYEEAESRRRLTEMIEGMEEEREYWMGYIDQYLKDYQEYWIN